MDEQPAIEVLKELNRFIIHYKIIAWLDQGTLLGAIREKRLLPHDSDVDFGFLFKDAKLLLTNISQLRNQGFQVQIHASNIYLKKNNIEINFMGYQIGVNRSFCFDYFLLDYISLGYWSSRWQQLYDIATHRESQSIIGKLAKFEYYLTYFRTSRLLLEKISYLGWKLSGGSYAGYHTPLSFYDNLDIIDLYGMKWLVPSKVEKYLTYKYGNDWKITKTKWDVWNDDGGIVNKIQKVYPNWKTLKNCYEVNS